MLNHFIDEISYIDNLYILLKNSFGNFVVQKAMSLDVNYKNIIVGNIFQCLKSIKDQNLVNRWLLILVKCQNSLI